MNFFENVIDFLKNIGVLDIVDILLVWVLLYFAYKFIREQNATKLAVGVMLLLVVQFVSNYFELSAMQFLLQTVFQVGLIALIVVFQPELRSALEKVGSEPLRGIRNLMDPKEENEYENDITNICEAVCDLAMSKTGALIVIERSQDISDLLKHGTKLNASINILLLKNIFYDKAPLHDGAVLIRGRHIAGAAYLLPLSTSEKLDPDLGTRHRAAVGITEHSDAISVVVSEETGRFSICCQGELTVCESYTFLKDQLQFYLLGDQASGGGAKPKSIKNKLRAVRKDRSKREEGKK